MFDRIVVPFDGPDVLDAVLPTLTRVIGQRDAEIILLKLERPHPEGGGSGEEDEIPSKFLLNPSRTTRLARRGAPVEEILAVVEGTEASLVAMASQGRHGLARLLFGSLIERVIRSCPAPVLAVRAKEDVEPRDVHTVLLPIDESLDWKASAACAADLARRHEAAVIVLRATSPEGREAAERQAHELCGELVSAGVVAYAFVEEGAPASVIPRAAADHEADLIVMATHPRHGLSRLRLGGVMEDVLREARVPVMAVPAALSTAWVPAQAMVEE
ncbi:MAG TPA: universal stress protein [Planctomycetota bacterium]